MKLSAEMLGKLSGQIAAAIDEIGKPYGVFLVDCTTAETNAILAHVSENRLGIKSASLGEHLAALIEFFKPDNIPAKTSILDAHRNGVHHVGLIAIMAQHKPEPGGEAERITKGLKESGATVSDPVVIAFHEPSSGEYATANYEGDGWVMVEPLPILAEHGPTLKVLQEAIESTANGLAEDMITVRNGGRVEDPFYNKILRAALRDSEGGHGVKPRVISATIVVDGKQSDMATLTYSANGKLVSILLNDEDLPELAASILKTAMEAGDVTTRATMRAMRRMLNSPEFTAKLNEPSLAGSLIGEAERRLLEALFGKDKVRQVILEVNEEVANDTARENDDAEAPTAA